MNTQRKPTLRAQPFTCPREAALALLSRAVQRGELIERKSAQFLGSVAGGANITPRMALWLDGMLRRAELPAIEPVS